VSWPRPEHHDRRRDAVRSRSLQSLNAGDEVALLLAHRDAPPAEAHGGNEQHA
jgi:hypothetical protein